MAARKDTKSAAKARAGTARGTPPKIPAKSPAPRGGGAAAARGARGMGPRRELPAPWWKRRGGNGSIAIQWPAVHIESAALDPKPCQVDDGVFLGRQTVVEVPRVWCWCDSSTKSEYWLLRNPGEGVVAPFAACSAPGGPELLMLEYVEPDLTYPPPYTDPLDPAHRSAFHAAVQTYYLDRFGIGPDQIGVPQDFQTFLYVGANAPEPALESMLAGPALPGAARLTGTGVYGVRQLTNPTETSLFLAWLWRPAAPGDREVWILLDGNPADPVAPRFQRPGSIHADSTLQFEFIQEDLPGADLAGDESGALDAFDAWVRDGYEHARDSLRVIENLRVVEACGPLGP